MRYPALKNSIVLNGEEVAMGHRDPLKGLWGAQRLLSSLLVLEFVIFKLYRAKIDKQKHKSNVDRNICMNQLLCKKRGF